jgi:hypothetical protein
MVRLQHHSTQRGCALTPIEHLFVAAFVTQGFRPRERVLVDGLIMDLHQAVCIHEWEDYLA